MKEYVDETRKKMLFLKKAILTDKTLTNKQKLAMMQEVKELEAELKKREDPFAEEDIYSDPSLHRLTDTFGVYHRPHKLVQKKKTLLERKKERKEEERRRHLEPLRGHPQEIHPTRKKHLLKRIRALNRELKS